MALRVVYLGTPEFAIDSLQAVVDAGHEVALVVSQPDRRRGRRAAPSPSPLRAHALGLGLPTCTLAKGERAVLYERILSLRPDLAIVVAFGHIIREPLLSVGRFGCVNVHASLLPRWRGPAPIHRAILAGDTRSGVCTMQLAAGVDTGDVYVRKELAIEPDETTGELHDRLAGLGAMALVETLRGLEDGSLTAVAQPEEGVTYAPMLEKHEGSVDFAAPAKKVHDRIRGLDPWPAVTVLCDDRRLRLGRCRLVDPTSSVHAPGEVVAFDEDAMLVQCGRGIVRIGQVQPAGRRPMTPVEFARGSTLALGTRLAPLPDFAPREGEQ